LLYYYNDTEPPELYSLSLHDALPILFLVQELSVNNVSDYYTVEDLKTAKVDPSRVKVDKKGRLYHEETEDCVFQLPYYEIRFERSEEHTSELQSRENLVCRLLLEKKK